MNGYLGVTREGNVAIPSTSVVQMKPGMKFETLVYAMNFQTPKHSEKKRSFYSTEKELIHFQTALVYAMHFYVVKQFSIFLFYEDKKFSKIKCFG